jgi:hypothetical protein
MAKIKLTPEQIEDVITVMSQELNDKKKEEIKKLEEK